VTEVALAHVSADCAVETPRQYFRRFLGLNAPALADLGWYFDQAVPRFSEGSEVRLAVEELVDQVGRIVGFDVAREEDDGYGAWSSAGGSVLLVWVLDAATALRQIGHAARARDAMLASGDAPPNVDATCLFVLCGAVNRRQLDGTVALRRASDHVRLVTLESLRLLAALVERRALTHDGALLLLRPSSAFADAVLSLAAEAVGLGRAEQLTQE
jgi:hypothetical protein